MADAVAAFNPYRSPLWALRFAITWGGVLERNQSDRGSLAVVGILPKLSA
jgi:hypothetical protein